MVSRRAILGVLIGGGGGAAAVTQLGTHTEPPTTDQQRGVMDNDTETPSATRSSTPTATADDGSNVDTLTPREDTATPPDQPTETATETQAPTATETRAPTATPTDTETETPTASRRTTVSYRGTRTEIVLTRLWTDVRVISFDAEIIDDPTRIRVRLFVRNTSDQTYSRLGALAVVPDPPTNIAGVSVINERGRSVDTDVSPGGRASLYPRVEWHPDLDRVEVVVDSGAEIQQTRTETPTPTPTPTEGGFL